MDTGTTLFLGVIGVIIMIFIIYGILARGKGTLKITLLENSKSSGEKFNGSIELIAKRKIESERFYIALVGKEKHTRHQNGSEKTSYFEIYRFEKTIEGEKIYSAGFQEKFNFEIDIPFAESIGKNNSNGLNFDFGKFIEENKLNDTFIGKATNFIVSNNGLSNNKILVWQIQTNIDAKGIDLSKNQNVYVNLYSNSIKNVIQN